MRAEVSKAHNPGHTVFHFGAGPDATFVGHLAVSPLHLATGLCPQQHPEPELAWKLLHDYADDGRILIGPLWPSPGYGRWSGTAFSTLSQRRTTSRPIVSRRSIASSASGISSKFSSRPIDGADPTGAQQLQDRRVRGLSLGARRPVEAERAARTERIGDVDETDAAQIEKLPYASGRGVNVAVFELDVLTESRDQVPAVHAHALERLHRSRAAHRVERDVDAASVRELLDHGHEVVRAVVDRVIGAELAAVARPSRRSPRSR